LKTTYFHFNLVDPGIQDAFDEEAGGQLEKLARHMQAPAPVTLGALSLVSFTNSSRQRMGNN